MDSFRGLGSTSYDQPPVRVSSVTSHAALARLGAARCLFMLRSAAYAVYAVSVYAVYAISSLDTGSPLRLFILFILFMLFMQ